MSTERIRTTDYPSRFRQILLLPEGNESNQGLLKIAHPRLDPLIHEIVLEAGNKGIDQNGLFRALGLDPKVALTTEQIQNGMRGGWEVPSLSEHYQDVKLARVQSTVQVGIFSLLMQGEITIGKDKTKLVHNPKTAQSEEQEVDLKQIYRYVANNKLREIGLRPLLIDDQRIIYLVYHVIKQEKENGITENGLLDKIGASKFDSNVNQALLYLIGRIQRKKINNEERLVIAK